MKKYIFSMIKFPVWGGGGVCLGFLFWFVFFFLESPTFMGGKSENLPETFSLRLFKRQPHRSQPHFRLLEGKIQVKN